ncbi:MAG: 2OG-Fe(II) oxygenase, partial [Phycicoccus sp.]
ERCRAHDQVRPTPLLLRYGPGDYNTLHQDRYGSVAFPLQVVVGLSEPGVDYTGGEFVLTEQRPRAQSRVSSIPLRRGHGVVFPNDRRPVQGAGRVHHVTHRHGASEVLSGRRVALAVIFHDAT